VWAIVSYAQAGSPEPLYHSGNSPTLLNKNLLALGIGWQHYYYYLNENI